MEPITVIHKEFQIAGLKKAYRILHVTDVHITLWDKRDGDTVITEGAHKGKKLVDEFGVKRARHFSVDGIPMSERFAALCDSLKACDPSFADVVVFTGDILDFYTDAAFEFMVENMKKLPMPYLFVLGNHDYIFSNCGTEAVFERFSSICGGSCKIQKFKLGELTLVGCHNGEYAYDAETLELIESAICGETNVLLFQHVPINSPSFEEFSKATGKNNVAIGAENCPSKGDSRERFMGLIDRADSPVRALICGDWHLNYSGPLTERVTQYISPFLRDFPPVLFTVRGR